jgi:hypothetical protein
MRHIGSYRLYDSVLRRLASRGHSIDIVVNKREGLEWGSAPQQLLSDLASVSWHWTDDVEADAWLELATVVRIWLDYLRYFEPRYEAAPRLRTRAEERVPAFVVQAMRHRAWRSPAGRRCLARGLRIIERALPRQRHVDAMIRELRPDLVLLTPLLHLGSSQIEVLRSAKALGVRTGVCIGSWDHLSSKSLIRELPDRVFVWNETQKREAIELHRIPGNRLVVTGAQCYDHWFDRQPSRPRDAFARRVGLPADRPIILYVGSALFVGSPVEADFVLDWIRRIRGSGVSELADAAVLIRPHPARLAEWKQVDLAQFSHVALYGAHPVDDETRQDYFESLFYASAVVGLNTSAFLEAAVVGRPVHTILLPQFRENQEGTLHFHYLLPANGGPLVVARSFEEHLAQLADSLRAPDAGRSQRFVEAFIRPAGRFVSATDVFADAVEALGREAAPGQAAQPIWAFPLRAGLWPAARLARFAMQRAGTSDRTSYELQRARLKIRHRQEKQETERVRLEARERIRQEKGARALSARAALQQHRERAREDAEREKAAVRREKERRKVQQVRAKRRALLKHRIKQKLGLA